MVLTGWMRVLLCDCVQEGTERNAGPWSACMHSHSNKLGEANWPFGVEGVAAVTLWIVPRCHQIQRKARCMHVPASPSTFHIRPLSAINPSDPLPLPPLPSLQALLLHPLFLLLQCPGLTQGRLCLGRLSGPPFARAISLDTPPLS